MAKSSILAVLLTVGTSMPTVNRRTSRSVSSEYELPNTPAPVIAPSVAPADRRRAEQKEFEEQKQLEGAGGAGDSVELTSTRPRSTDGCDGGIWPGRYMQRRSSSS